MFHRFHLLPPWISSKQSDSFVGRFRLAGEALRSERPERIHRRPRPTKTVLRTTL
ncbi:hypothetical protein B4113_1366 [Geobacillus sp. B4113_201601]|nr:hypothetical protein B4113_1366 [Geobacillus sp. B4113_201601]